MIYNPTPEAKSKEALCTRVLNTQVLAFVCTTPKSLPEIVAKYI